MRLSEKDRYAFREKIEVMLRKVPEGQRIKLDKDLLEDLLFVKKTVNKEKGITAKIPVWSGKFLRKIDLSDVSFDDVSWTMLNDTTSAKDFEMDEEFVKQMELIQRRNNDRYINYSFTNANIDLTKSFETVNCGVVSIWECNFEGVDFKSQDLSKVKSISIKYSNISNTKLKIPANISLKGYQSNFTNIDLSAFTIDGNKAIELKGDPEETLSECILTNTGIRIAFDIKKYKAFSDNQKRLNINISYFLSDQFVSIQEIFNDYWGGCYLNDRRISTVEERKESAKKKRIEYEQMKEDILSATKSSIEEQAKVFKKSV